MKYTTVVLAAALGAQSVVGLMINTPMNVVACQPVKLDWSGSPGTPPYYLSVIPGGQPSAQALKQFPPMESGTSITWKVDIQAGTDISIALKDSTGTTAYTDHLMIQSGSDTSCVNTSQTPATVSGGASGATAVPTTAGATSAAPSGSASASSSSSARPTGSQAAAASASPTNNAAIGITQTFTGTFAGVLAIAGALLL